jgi:hypothetical protein
MLRRNTALILPSFQTKAAFTVCFIARFMEVCLKSEKWRFLSAPVVVPSVYFIPLVIPQKGLGSLTSRTRCNQPA